MGRRGRAVASLPGRAGGGRTCAPSSHHGDGAPRQVPERLYPHLPPPREPAPERKTLFARGRLRALGRASPRDFARRRSPLLRSPAPPLGAPEGGQGVGSGRRSHFLQSRASAMSRPLLAVLLACGCASRVPIAPPDLPLARTPDAAFRARAPAA